MLGLKLEDGVGWCPRPGHDGMATIAGHVDWGLAYSCDCNRRGWYDRPCADALYSLRTGQELRRCDDQLSNGTRWVYRALLTYEVGLLEPAHVELPELASTSNLEQEARRFFALLLGLRMATGDDGPMPFTQRLVAANLGVALPEAWRAIQALIVGGVIREVDRHGRTPLYVPGACHERS